MEFKVVQGNIIDAKVDAIVLPANTKLKEGAGTSRAIFEAAGRKELTKVCKKIGYCEMGAAVPTLGYNLGCNYILHAVVPRWKDGKHNEYEFLSSAYLYTLELADVMECKSIAFPILASGNNGFSLEFALEIAFESIRKFEAKHKLEEVIIVAYENRVAMVIREKGINVSVLPRNLEKERREREKSASRKKLFDDAKDIVQNMIEEQVQKGLDYFKEEENRERVIQLGAVIVKNIIQQGTISYKNSSKIDIIDEDY